MFGFEFGANAGKKYFKNIIVNILFSALALLSFYSKLCLMAAEALGANEILLIFACEVFLCVFAAIYVCFILKRLPTSFSRLSLLAGAWSVLLFAKDMIIFYAGKSFIENRGFLFAVSALLFAVIFGLFLLSLCKALCNYKGRLVLLKPKNLFYFIKTVANSLLTLTVVCLFFFTSVNTRAGRSGMVVISKEVTERWEPRLFSIVLFFLFPLYSSVLIQLFEELLQETNQEEKE